MKWRFAMICSLYALPLACAIAYSVSGLDGPRPIDFVDQDRGGLGVALEIAADSDRGASTVVRLP
ncbi:MAG: hypothetical protein R3B09_09635 [Nannocystaceae bacterium]